MTALRCTQKLLTAMKVTPPAPGANRLGDWSLNLLHTRPKRVVAISEHDRLGLLLEAAPYATLKETGDIHKENAVNIFHVEICRKILVSDFVAVLVAYLIRRQ